MSEQSSSGAVVGRSQLEWIGKPIWGHTRGLVVCGVLSAALFATNLLFGSVLVYATGIPGLSAAVSGLFVPFLLSLSALITGRQGSVALVWITYSILAVPTVLNGPPGIYKIVIGVIAGFAYDLPITFSKGKAWGHYLGLVTYVILNLGAFWFAFGLLQLPGEDAFRKAVIAVASLFLVEGLISVTLANVWYRRRLRQLEFVKRLRNN